jgi:hypothetical protein
MLKMLQMWCQRTWISCAEDIHLLSLRAAIKNKKYINADYAFDKFEYKEETKLIL